MKKEFVILLSVVTFGFIVVISILGREKQSNQQILLSNQLHGFCENFLIENNTDLGSITITPDNFYGPTWEYTEEQVEYKGKNKLDLELDIKALDTSQPLSIVFEIRDKSIQGDQLVKYSATAIEVGDSTQPMWHHTNISLPLGTELTNNHYYKLYFWNQKNKNYLINNFKMSTSL